MGQRGQAKGYTEEKATALSSIIIQKLGGYPWQGKEAKEGW